MKQKKSSHCVARDAYETESSSSDRDDNREIAASGPGATFCETHGENNRDARRSEVARPVNAVKALKDWRISFSGSSSADAEEFLERLAEMQLYYRLRDVEILEAIRCALRTARCNGSGRSRAWPGHCANS